MDALLKLIVDAFKALVPPLDADPEHQYRWRLAVFVWGAASWVVLITFATLAFGKAPALFPGFARNDVVHDIINHSQVKDIGDLRRSILLDQEKFCNAASPGPDGNPKNRSAAGIWLRLRQDDLAAYDSAAPHGYHLPSCAEVLVGGFTDDGQE